MEKIQGNILKPFARPHARYLFFQFDDHPEQVRPRLKTMLKSVVTWAQRQQELTATWKGGGCKATGATVGMFGLSYAGYERLQLESTVPRSGDLDTSHFEPGMRHPPSILWRPDIARWSGEYRDHTLEAFLLLASDDPGRLEQAVYEAKSDISGFGEVVTEERGVRIPVRGTPEASAEPFGFRDGIAEILEPESVFTEESWIACGFGCFATYAKFEQDVRRFHQGVAGVVAKAKAQALDVSADQVASVAVGRKPDGTPLVPAGPKGLDDFSFDGVPETVCPAYAHIRAMNPRTGPLQFPIIRRGIPLPHGGD